MNAQRTRGFTLIELLTVIAIIAILASITFVGLSRAREAAKIRRMEAAMNQVRTVLTSYYTTAMTYPPAYGFRAKTTVGADLATVNNALNDPAQISNFFHLRPWTVAAGIHQQEDVYDEFSLGSGLGYETTRPPDNQLSLLEFSPIGDKNLATEVYSFTDSSGSRYNGSNLGQEVARQLDAEIRPFIYLPYNERQFKRAKRYWIERGDFLANTFDLNDPLLQGMSFPPPNYDNFVLIGVGPSGSTFGLLPDPIGGEAPADLYHILTLRAVFRALRDLNDNGELDFDFTARTTQNEAAAEYTVGNTPVNNQLPDPVAPNGAGPWIYTPL